MYNILLYSLRIKSNRRRKNNSLNFSDISERMYLKIFIRLVFEDNN